MKPGRALSYESAQRCSRAARGPQIIPDVESVGCSDRAPLLIEDERGATTTSR